MRRGVFGAFLVAAAGVLTACDGGSVFGETAGTGGGGTTPPPGTPTAATLTLIASAPQISSNAVQPANGVTLTATVKDSSNNIISGATVSFSTTDAGVNLTVTRGTTDASGTAQAVVTIGSDPTNRAVLVAATSGSAPGSVTVNVVGTTLTLSGPSNAQFNTPTTYIATLADSGGVGIAGKPVTFSSTGGSFSPSAAQNTNSSGQVSVAFTPTSTGSSVTLQAAALGLTASQTVTLSQDSFAFTAPLPTPPQTVKEINLNTPTTVSVAWTRSGAAASGTVTFSSTRGTIEGGDTSTNVDMTDGSGTATVTIVSTQAGLATIVANGSSATSSPSTSITVEFVAVTPSQISVQADPAIIATNQQSTVTAVVRDNNNNLVKNAVVDFSLQDTTGGTISSAAVTTNSQGLASVVYSSGSTPSAQNGVSVTATVRGTTISRSATLTVGSRAARIVLGTGNEISPSGTTAYEMPYTAIVTDNAGNAIAGAVIRLSIVTTEFSKGFYGQNLAGKNVQVLTVTCPNEDVNQDGILQSTEDTDSDGSLDPSNAASVPPTRTADENGRAEFTILYPRDRGNWSTVRLTASTTVSGTEANESVTIDLPLTADDFADPSPPGNPSPYGEVGSCDLDDSNAPTVQFEIVGQTVTENTASPTLTIKITSVVTATGAAGTQDVTVPLLFVGSADGGGADYTTTATSLFTIPASQSSATFDVTIVNDATVEVSEDILILMDRPTTRNAVIGTNDSHEIIILDDD